MKRILVAIIISLTTAVCIGQTVKVPAFDDQYCDYVKRLESGETGIDYQAFRFSFLESEQFKIASRSSERSSLIKDMRKQMDKSNYDKVIKITKEMLSIDYTNMLAHKILRQTYKILGDTTNETKYKTIQFGLLNSIVKKGDGQSCETAWPIIQIAEAYFILEMLGAKPWKQTTVTNAGVCDKMDVKIEGANKTYYFETSKVFAGYKKLGIE